MKALELRMEGQSFDEIAKEVGYKGRQGAYEAVTRALREVTREPAQEVIRLDLERLDRMWSVHYLRAQAGDALALASCLRIMERRAKLLGLDAPEKKELTGKDGKPLVPTSAHEMTDEQLAAIAAGGGAAAS